MPKLIDFAYLSISQTYFKKLDLYLKLATLQHDVLMACNPPNNLSVFNYNVKYCILLLFNIYSNYKENSTHVYCITVFQEYHFF
jgi:hypothetical protein